MDIEAAGRVAGKVYKATMNGSPVWRFAMLAAVLYLGYNMVYGSLNETQAGEVDEKIAPIQSDIAALVSAQNKKALEDLTDSLLATKRDQCDAVREGRNASAWTKRISELMRDYYERAKTPFDMPGCGEV